LLKHRTQDSRPFRLQPPAHSVPKRAAAVHQSAHPHPPPFSGVYSLPTPSQQIVPSHPSETKRTRRWTRAARAVHGHHDQDSCLASAKASLLRLQLRSVDADTSCILSTGSWTIARVCAMCREAAGWTSLPPSTDRELRRTVSNLAGQPGGHGDWFVIQWPQLGNPSCNAIVAFLSTRSSYAALMHMQSCPISRVRAPLLMRACPATRPLAPPQLIRPPSARPHAAPGKLGCLESCP
jgi:hypothetical protein